MAIVRGLAFVCSSESIVSAGRVDAGVTSGLAAGGTSGQNEAAAAVRRQAQGAFLGLLGHRLPAVQLTTLALLENLVMEVRIARRGRLRCHT